MNTSDILVTASFCKPDKFGNPLFIITKADSKSFTFLKNVMDKIDRKYSNTYNPINVSSRDTNLMFMKGMKSAMDYTPGTRYRLTIVPIVKSLKKGKTALIRIMASEELEEEYELLDVSDFTF